MPRGPIALFGSGETSRRGRQVHSELLRRLPLPLRIAVLEDSGRLSAQRCGRVG